MEVLEFLNNAEIIQLVQQYNITKLHKKQVSYNLFTISSYNSYLENFHSDIISSRFIFGGIYHQAKQADFDSCGNFVGNHRHFALWRFCVLFGSYDSFILYFLSGKSYFSFLNCHFRWVWNDRVVRF